MKLQLPKFSDPPKLFKVKVRLSKRNAEFLVKELKASRERPGREGATIKGPTGRNRFEGMDEKQLRAIDLGSIPKGQLDAYSDALTAAGVPKLKRGK